MNPPLLASVFVLVLFGTFGRGQAKVLELCDAVTKLQRGGISRSLVSSWICMMQAESRMDTTLVTGPKTLSTHSYGIFQINSYKWCKPGRAGGDCNKRCEDLAKDDITDAIVCAKKILLQEGFKHWEGWTRNCKNKPLPNISHCNKR